MSTALSLDVIAPLCQLVYVTNIILETKNTCEDVSFHVDQSDPHSFKTFPLLTSIIKFCSSMCPWMSREREVNTIEIEFHFGNLATLGGRERKKDSRNRERKSGRKEKVNRELVPCRHDLSQ